MLFLLCNDDGVRAPGLKALHRALSPLGRCLVVAPLNEQSAVSHTFSLHRPLRVQQVAPGWYGVDGSPADAVYMGLHHLCPEPPALVVSGINRGANLSTDTLYSGTVAAAMEAALAGYPAVAASLFVDWQVPVERHHWSTAEAVVARVAAQVLARGLPEGVFINLNVPDVPPEALQGLCVTRLGRRHYGPRVVERRDPWNRPYYWVGGAHEGFDGGPDSDGTAISRGWASLTPMHADRTAASVLPELQQWSGIAALGAPDQEGVEGAAQDGDPAAATPAATSAAGRPAQRQ